MSAITFMARALLVGTVLALLAACAREPVLDVEDAWIREAPEGATVLAGYMRVVHRGHGADFELVGADSPHFGRIELHATRTDGERMRMEQLDTVALVGDATRFEPGGLHLMLMAPDGEVRSSDLVPVQLHFSDGRSIDVDFEVRDMRPRS